MAVAAGGGTVEGEIVGGGIVGGGIGVCRGGPEGADGAGDGPPM